MIKLLEQIRLKQSGRLALAFLLVLSALSSERGFASIHGTLTIGDLPRDVRSLILSKLPLSDLLLALRSKPLNDAQKDLIWTHPEMQERLNQLVQELGSEDEQKGIRAVRLLSNLPAVTPERLRLLIDAACAKNNKIQRSRASKVLRRLWDQGAAPWMIRESQATLGTLTQGSPIGPKTTSNGIDLAHAVTLAGLLQPSFSRSETIAEVRNLEAQIKAKLTMLLAPESSHVSQNFERLENSDQGIVRLLPRGRYTGSTIREDGAYFSFCRNDHSYGYGSDIELQSGQFSVGFAGCDFGFFISLGDNMPLDSIDLEDPRLKFLLEFRPATNEPDARVHQTLAYETNQNGFKYKNRATFQVGETLVLRSIDYGTSDLLVGIQVLSIDPDDESVVFSWKLLKTFEIPTLRNN